MSSNQKDTPLGEPYYKDELLSKSRHKRQRKTIPSKAWSMEKCSKSLILTIIN